MGGGNGLQGRYCFLSFFFVHQTNVKILIGQILNITQSVVLIGQRPVTTCLLTFIQNLKSCVNIFLNILKTVADGLNTFTQYFAVQLAYVTFRFIWQTLQTSLQLFSCFEPASYSFFHSPKIFNFFHFRTKKN